MSAVTQSSPADDPKPNWDLARALYLQGVKNSAIAEECNVKPEQIRLRASRGKWNQERIKLKAELIRAGQERMGITLPSVTEAGLIVRQVLSGALLKASEGLDQVKAPKSHKARQELAATVKAISDPGKTLYAWEEQKPTVVINLGTLKSARLPEPIDVQSQAVLPQADTPQLPPAQ